MKLYNPVRMSKIQIVKKLTRLLVVSSPIFCINVSSCSKPYKYPNYSLVCMGDSITWGMLPNGRQMKTPYPKALQSRLSFGHSYNYGICGSTISSGTGCFDPMVNRIGTMTKDANIVIFWGGVNDYRFGCELGNEGDTTPNTVYGALDTISNYIVNTYADKFVMFITPLPTTVAPKSYELVSVCDAIKYSCNKYSIPLLDLYSNSGFEEEMTKSSSDGIHPSQDFVKNSIVPKIYDFIIAHILI